MFYTYPLSDLPAKESSSRPSSSCLGKPHSPSGCTDTAKLLVDEGHELERSVTGVDDLDVSLSVSDRRLSAEHFSNGV